MRGYSIWACHLSFFNISCYSWYHLFGVKQQYTSKVLEGERNLQEISFSLLSFIGRLCLWKKWTYYAPINSQKGLAGFAPVRWLCLVCWQKKNTLSYKLFADFHSFVLASVCNPRVWAAASISHSELNGSHQSLHCPDQQAWLGEGAHGDEGGGASIKGHSFGFAAAGHLSPYKDLLYKIFSLLKEKLQVWIPKMLKDVLVCFMSYIFSKMYLVKSSDDRRFNLASKNAQHQVKFALWINSKYSFSVSMPPI